MACRLEAQVWTEETTRLDGDQVFMMFYKTGSTVTLTADA